MSEPWYKGHAISNRDKSSRNRCQRKSTAHRAKESKAERNRPRSFSSSRAGRDNDHPRELMRALAALPARRDVVESALWRWVADELRGRVESERRHAEPVAQYCARVRTEGFGASADSPSGMG
jgi:hypothetical protein